MEISDWIATALTANDLFSDIGLAMTLLKVPSLPEGHDPIVGRGLCSRRYNEDDVS